MVQLKTSYCKGLFVVLACIVLQVNVLAQKPKGVFLSDSISIGMPLQYALSFRHNARLNVFFPDSLHNFAPFEFVKWQVFDTRTDERGSLDSVVYLLRSFDVSRVQALQVPVSVQTSTDSLTIYTEADSVYLREKIKGSVKGLLPLIDLRMVPIEQEINYLFILLGLFLFLLAMATINWVFGDKIKKWWRMFQLLQNHVDFTRNFQRLQRGVTEKSKITNIEKALVLWKNYLELLERKPYSSFTSKEIVDSMPNLDLAESLREIDMTIYGGADSANTMASLETLKQVAQSVYQRRRLELSSQK
jgi:hypothetical protein